MKCYPASKSHHGVWWQALRAAGVPIVATWLDWARNHDSVEPTDDEWREHWQRCISEASDSDVLLFVALKGERQCGALIEIGAALSAGKRVFLVSPYEWSIAHHPRCRTFRSIAEAVEAIMAEALAPKLWAVK